MAMSAFGVEDSRISKADDRRHGPSILGTTALGAGTAAGAGTAVHFGQGANFQRKRQKANLGVAEDSMGRQWEEMHHRPELAEAHQHWAQSALERAGEARKLKYKYAGGAAGAAGTAAGLTAVALRRHRTTS